MENEKLNQKSIHDKCEQLGFIEVQSCSEAFLLGVKTYQKEHAYLSQFDFTCNEDLRPKGMILLFVQWYGANIKEYLSLEYFNQLENSEFSGLYNDLLNKIKEFIYLNSKKK